MIAWLQDNMAALLNVIMIDIVLAGDNAIIVGLAASRVKPAQRSKVIFWGIAGAVVLRLVFAALATQLLAIVGLTLAGGILLLWVCWKMYRQLSAGHAQDHEIFRGGGTARGRLGFWPALWQIIVADVSMSLDNVLAVAGAAKGEPVVLIIGLGVAVALMAVASTYIADILARHPSITWIGLAIILYVAVDMIWDGSREVACEAYGGFWCGESKSLIGAVWQLIVER